MKGDKMIFTVFTFFYFDSKMLLQVVFKFHRTILSLALK